MFVSAAAAHSVHRTDGECKHWRNLLYWLEFICTSTIDSPLEYSSSQPAQSLSSVHLRSLTMNHINRSPFHQLLHRVTASLGLLLWWNIGNPFSFTVKFFWDAGEKHQPSLSLIIVNVNDRCLLGFTDSTSRFFSPQLYGKKLIRIQDGLKEAFFNPASRVRSWLLIQLGSWLECVQRWHIQHITLFSTLAPIPAVFCVGFHQEVENSNRQKKENGCRWVNLQWNLLSWSHHHSSASKFFLNRSYFYYLLFKALAQNGAGCNGSQTEN